MHDLSPPVEVPDPSPGLCWRRTKGRDALTWAKGSRVPIGQTLSRWIAWKPDERMVRRAADGKETPAKQARCAHARCSGRIACEYPLVAEYTKVKRWNRWSRPFSDIVQTAHDAIAAGEGWREPAGQVRRSYHEIDVIDREIQSTFSSVDELAAIDDRDLATIRSIRVRASWMRHSRAIVSEILKEPSNEKMSGEISGGGPTMPMPGGGIPCFLHSPNPE